MKRGLISLVFILLFTTIVSAQVVIHPASNFRIDVDGSDRTLQDAINNSLLMGTHSYSIPSPIPNLQHGADEIWISTNDGEMTLLNALENNVPLEKSSFSGYSSTNIPNPVHFATEVELSSGKNLQEAINDGTLASSLYSWQTGSWSSCSPSNSCDSIVSRSVNCVNNDNGEVVSDSKCSDPKPDDRKACYCQWEYQSTSCEWGIYGVGCNKYKGETCKDLYQTEGCKAGNCGASGARNQNHAYRCEGPYSPV